MVLGFKRDGTTRVLFPQRGAAATMSGMPEEKWTNESGWVDLWAPPRGYAVYVPM